MGKRIAIIGSREFPSSGPVSAVVASLPKDTVVASGGAHGVDRWAEEAASASGLECQIYRADWDRLGPKAGSIRNTEIVADCDEVVAFWDGRSRGTLNTIVQALRASLEVRVFDQDGSGVPLETVTRM